MISLTSADRYDRAELGGSQQTLVEWARSAPRVLEFGPSTGFMSQVLRDRGSHVTAVEIDRDALAILRTRADVAQWGDLEQPDTLSNLDGSLFDVVVFADVLEHLRDPLEALKLVLRWLADDGRILVSMPNVGYWSVRLALARGQWEMTKSGIMDETHLRFFTRSTAERMFSGAGLDVQRLEHVWGDVPLDNRVRLHAPRLLPIKSRVNALVRNRFPDAMAFQHLWELRRTL